jgi:hypothetical protein
MAQATAPLLDSTRLLRRVLKPGGLMAVYVMDRSTMSLTAQPGRLVARARHIVCVSAAIAMHAFGGQFEDAIG